RLPPSSSLFPYTTLFRSTAEGVDVAICPPFLALQAMIDSTRGSRVQVFAQNMHQADSGAFTGEVSPPMLAELGVHGTLVGHSERSEEHTSELQSRFDVVC